MKPKVSKAAPSAKPRVTAFQELVYDATSRIPSGAVVSYIELARLVECGSPRAVGQALRRCPYAHVPCHRVVSSDGSMEDLAGRMKGRRLKRKSAF